MPAKLFRRRKRRAAALLAASAAVAGVASAQRTNAATIDGTVAAGEYPAGAIATMDLRASLAEIRATTLVVAGAQDRATTVDDAALISRSIPGGR